MAAAQRFTLDALIGFKHKNPSAQSRANEQQNVSAMSPNRRQLCPRAIHLTRGSIIFARRHFAKMMDCQVKPGNDGGEMVPAMLGPFDRNTPLAEARTAVTVARA